MTTVNQKRAVLANLGAPPNPSESKYRGRPDIWQHDAAQWLASLVQQLETYSEVNDARNPLFALVDDTNPKAGGSLDVNGFAIVSADDGDIPITPDGSGSIILDGLSWPQTDGSAGQVLVTDGAGQTSWATQDADVLAGVNTQTGTAYTLQASDSGQVVEMNNASANTVTIDTQANASYPANMVAEVVQIGAGTTTIAAAMGVTLRSADSAVNLRAQYSGATLYRRGDDDWVLVGDIA